MEGRMNTEFGEITVDSDVISIYAGSVAVECFGIVGMAAVSMKDGLVKLLRRENTDDLKHGISVKIEDNSIYLSFHVIVAYGVNGTVSVLCLTSMPVGLVWPVMWKAQM